MTTNIICSGPGPHLPASGILGTGDRPVTGMFCASDACQATLTSAQTTAQAADANRGTIQQQALTALVSNRTYLAIASPTNAQVVAQLRAITQQNQGLIRLVLNQLDATN